MKHAIHAILLALLCGHALAARKPKVIIILPMTLAMAM
jgi:hypothetical protein